MGFPFNKAIDLTILRLARYRGVKLHFKNEINIRNYVVRADFSKGLASINEDILTGIAWAGGGGLTWFENEERDHAFPNRIGHQLDSIVDQMTALQPYLLNVNHGCRNAI